MDEEQKKEQEKQQVVYMVPSQDLEEDEIDLWQLILPLVRYKVQIILFLLAGLAVGFGVSWRDYRKSADAGNVEVPQLTGTALYQNRLDKLLEQRQILGENLLDEINRIEDHHRIMEVVAAEYRYQIPGDPPKTGTVKLSQLGDFNPDLMTRGSEEYLLLFSVEPASSSDLKSRLKKAYLDLEKQLEEMAAAELVKTGFIVDKLQDIGIGETSGSTPYSPLQDQRLLSDPAYRQLDAGLKALTGQSREIKTRIGFLLYSLSEQLTANLKASSIPFSVWSDISNQVHQGIKDRDRSAYQQVAAVRSGAEQVLSVIEEIGETRGRLHFESIRSDIPDELLRLSGLSRFYADNRQPKSVPPFNPFNKLVLISLIIAFFLGIFSVYLRVLIANARKGQGFEKQKKEFMEALKFWKL